MKDKIFSPKAYLTYFVIAFLIAVFLIYRYVTSFTEVSFVLIPNDGSITLINQDNQHIKPSLNTPFHLKKGTYTVEKHGDHVINTKQRIAVDGSRKKISIYMDYTDKYLTKLYSKEQINIYTALLLKYPKINSDYTISGGQLFNRGEWFGAALHYNNRSSDNRDTLYVILHKENNTWKVISTPPAPILSRQLYPDVPYETLKSINLIR